MRLLKRLAIISLLLAVIACGCRFLLTLYPSRTLVVEYRATNDRNHKSLISLDKQVRDYLLADGHFIGAYALPENKGKKVFFHGSDDDWPILGVRGSEFAGLGINSQSGDSDTLFLYVTGFKSDQRYSKKLSEMQTVMNAAIGLKEMERVKLSLRTTPIFSGMGDP
jgi:hypothetical protein